MIERVLAGGLAIFLGDEPPRDDATLVGAATQGSLYVDRSTGAIYMQTRVLPGPLQWSGLQITHQAYVRLTDAEIKTLPTTPVVILAASDVLGGVGTPTRLPILLDVHLYTNNWPAAYVGADPFGHLKVYLGSDGRDGYGAVAAELSVVDTVLLNTGVNARWLPIAHMSYSLVDALPDTALVLQFDTAGDDLTGGDAANTLTAVVLYLIWDVAAGRYV